MTIPAPADIPRLALTAAEAAESLGVSERHLSGLAVEGKAPSVMLGHRRVFPVDVLREWMRGECSKWLGPEQGQANVQDGT